MSDNAHESHLHTLQNEINTMRGQIEGLVKTIGEKKDSIAASVEEKLAAEAAHYRLLAKENMGRVYDAGSEGIEELGNQVRRNPLASIGIAFAAGFVLASLIRRL